jgi:hypothetical protein
MLRTTNPERSLWEAILPAEAIGLSTELTMVDRLLDDPVFIQPFRVHFDPIIGRPSIPIDTYLGLLARAVDKLHSTAKRVQAAGVRPAAGSGTVGGRLAAAPMRSPGPCDLVSVMPSRSSWRSPGSSPGWPRRNWPTPAGS